MRQAEEMGIRSEEMFKSIPKYLVPKPFDQVRPAVLHGPDRIGDFDQLAGGYFRIGVGALGGELHAAALSSLSAPHATIINPSSATSRQSAFCHWPFADN
jgi:hypothetical protein